jgi:hypothetical protein
MDPGAVQVGLSLLGTVVGSAVTGAIWYGTLRGWMARREVTEAQLVKDVEDHETRIRELERDSRPVDYAR